jgi:hypothetical protein
MERRSWTRGEEARWIEVGFAGKIGGMGASDGSSMEIDV